MSFDDAGVDDGFLMCEDCGHVQCATGASAQCPFCGGTAWVPCGPPEGER